MKCRLSLLLSVFILVSCVSSGPANTESAEGISITNSDNQPIKAESSYSPTDEHSPDKVVIRFNITQRINKATLSFGVPGDTETLIILDKYKSFVVSPGKYSIDLYNIDKGDHFIQLKPYGDDKK